MYIAKETSTNQENKKMALSQCPVTFTLDRIGGRWKVLILYHLKDGPMRYGVLKRTIPAISEKMLIQQLKELEADKLVVREVLAVVPPNVTYGLTEAGKALGPAMNAMAAWGIQYSTDNVYMEVKEAAIADE